MSIPFYECIANHQALQREVNNYDDAQRLADIITNTNTNV